MKVKMPVSALPLTRRLALSKTPNLCVLRFPHLQLAGNRMLPTSESEIHPPLGGTDAGSSAA